MDKKETGSERKRKRERRETGSGRVAGERERESNEITAN
jgi:hypothetical protein